MLDMSKYLLYPLAKILGSNFLNSRVPEIYFTFLDLNTGSLTL